MPQLIEPTIRPRKTGQGWILAKNIPNSGLLLLQLSLSEASVSRCGSDMLPYSLPEVPR